MATVRCKFRCTSITKRENWDKSKGPFLYDYEFSAVTGDSDENKSFFAATPSGSLKVGTVKDDIFVPGQAYYLDITPAE